MELDPNTYGFPQVKPTPHIVLGMTKGEIPEYLASFSSRNQKRKGLLVAMWAFLALEYSEIASAVMTILNDPNHRPTDGTNNSECHQQNHPAAIKYPNRHSQYVRV